MNDTEKVEKMLAIITEVASAAALESKGNPSSYFYPTGAPSLKLVQRIRDVIDGR